MELPSRAAGKNDGGRISDRVAADLRAMIARGELVPGQRLPGERQLAERLGVSRVSVRAALQSLKMQGFLEAIQGGGTRIISSASDLNPPLAQLLRLNPENLYDLTEIRGILEVWAAQRAALQATPEQIAALGRIVEAMADSRRRSHAHKVADDVDFHFTIGNAAGSAVYTHMMHVIRDILTGALEYHRCTLFQTPEEDAILFEQHRAVFEAIRARDAEAAGVAMRRHLDWIKDHYVSRGLHRTSGVEA